MGLTLDYEEIRCLSRKMKVFNSNIGRYVRLKLVGGYDYIVEPIEIKEMECFFKLIGKGMTEHPIVSHSIKNIMEIIPMR